jgi:diguanylate cyclase (GGDEF)-like protein
VMAHSVNRPLRAEFGRGAQRGLVGTMLFLGGLQLLIALRQLLTPGAATELHQSNAFNQGIMYLYLGGGAVFGFGFLQVVVLRLTRQLRESAQRDALTQLLNRRAMAERLTAAWRHHRRTGGPLALLMIDLDHFKTVNDTQGHAAGDLLLQRLARLLDTQMRGDDLVARYGGEEFLIALPDTHQTAAGHLAERLRAACERELGVTLSIGLTLVHDADRDVDATLRRADAALYRAKAAGRNRVEVT